MYFETKPIVALKSHIECIWTAEKSDGDGHSSDEQRILPDGCADLIFDLTPGLESAYWVGTMTKSFVLKESKSTKVVGVRFNPGGAKAFLGMPLSELTDQRAFADEITPGLAARIDSFLSKASILDLQASLVKALTQDRSLPVIQKIHQLIQDADGDLRVAEVSDQLGMSRQYLNRLMKESVGVDLKTFQRVLRMRLLSEKLSGAAGASVDWADLAVRHGFYDQSHLIHDFKDLIGLSPTEFLK